jgi:excisionase family DNA binding protein
MRELLKIGEVAELFGVQPPTVRRWLKAGKIQYILTPGGSIRVPADALVMHWEGLVDGRPV